MREWRAESRELPGHDLYLAETRGPFSDQGANSFHVLHGDDVAQDLRAARSVCGAFVGGRPWLVVRIRLSNESKYQRLRKQRLLRD
jgi:hypothetical protein